MRFVLALIAGLIFAGSANAQTPSSYALKDSNGVPFNVGVFLCPTNKICPLSVSSDSAGNPLSGPAGTTNPVNAALYMQGVTNGVPVNTQFSSPQHVICDSGCSGGGSGGDVNLTQILGVAPSATNPLWVSPAAGATFPVNGSVSISGSVPVTGTFWQTTQPVSIAGSVAVTGAFFQATQPISAAALPLPSGAATAALQGTGNTSLGSIDTKTPALGQALAAASVPVVLTAAQLSTLTPLANVGITGSVAVTGTFFQATQPISATALPLPSGAATSALQTTGNTSLATIAAGTPALGQALAAASVPVVLPALQITALTPPTTVTVTQATGTNLHMVCDSGCSSSTSPSFGASFPLVGTPIGMSQGGLFVAMTGTSGNLNVQCANCSGSGVSTADGATFTAGTSLFAGAGGIVQTTVTSNPVAAGSQGLFQMTANRALFVNLRDSSGNELGTAASALNIKGTGSAGTAAGGVMTVQGIASMTPIQTVVTNGIAVTNAGTFAVQLTGATNNINNIAGTISLPTGASTSALQTTGNTSLASIDTKTPALGQALAAASVPVVLTALQLTALTPPTTVTVTQATGTNLHMVCDSGCSSSTSPSFGTTFPSVGTPVGFSQGGNFVAMTGTSGALNVNVSSGSITATQLTAANLNATVVGTGTFAVQAAQSGTWNVTNISGTVSLPTGAATSALQTTGNTSLSSIDTKTPSLGQALAAASTPVVLPALQITALTPPTTVTVTQATGTNLHMVCDSGCSGSGGTSSAFAATFPANGTAIGAKNGTSMVNLTADASGNLNVNVQSALGTAIGATTAGSTGSGIMGAVTTSPPTYTTGQTNFVSMDTSGNVRVDGTSEAPTGAAVPGSASYMGGIALSAEPTAATTGNLVGGLRDLAGKDVTSPYANRENMVRGGGSSTTTTAITVMAAAGAGLKNYATDLSCTRSDAGTTAISVTLNDSSAMVIDIPNNGGGGGYTHTFNVPLATAANTALTVTPSAGVSTLHCTATGFKGY